MDLTTLVPDSRKGSLSAHPAAHRSPLPNIPFQPCYNPSCPTLLKLKTPSFPPGSPAPLLTVTPNSKVSNDRFWATRSDTPSWVRPHAARRVPHGSCPCPPGTYAAQRKRPRGLGQRGRCPPAPSIAGKHKHGTPRRCCWACGPTHTFWKVISLSYESNYPRDVLTLFLKRTCIWPFTLSLFVVLRCRRKSKSSSLEESTCEIMNAMLC